MLRFSALLALIACAANSLQAQLLQGTVVDSAARRPVAGSIVMALDAGGASVARTITNQRGGYRLTVPATARIIRVLHIGFRPSGAAVPAFVNGAAQLDVTLSLLGTVLDVIEVHDNPNCTVRPDRAQALALWEQARQGLLAMVVAREAMPARLKRLRYERTMDGTSDRIVRQEVTVDMVTGAARTFQASRSAQEFVRDGFVDQRTAMWTYYAPDADVMLEDAFFAGYCFRVMEPQRSHAGQVGVGFAVAKHRAGNVDIDGAFWIDTTARALTSIEFRYVGLEKQMERYRPGGRVEFREMSNGLVLIDRWALRLLAVRLDTSYVERERARNLGSALQAQERATFEVHETGGELASATWPDGVRWHASLGSLQLEAQMQAGGAAIGTAVSLEHTNYRARVDSSGTLVFNDLLPGPYRLIVHDTLLAQIGVTLKTPVEFVAARDSVYHASWIVPTAWDYALSLCREPKSNSSVAFFAYITTATGIPVSDGEVKEMRKLSLETAQWSATAFGGPPDVGGRYFSCWRYDRVDTVQIWVRRPGKQPALTLKALAGRVNVVRIVLPP